MKLKNSVSISIVLTLFCLVPLQSKKSTAPQASMKQPSIEQDAVSVLAYLSLFESAYEQNQQNNKQAPSISCKKCQAHELSFGEFQGGLVGKIFNDVVTGKSNFEQAKSTLDDCLNVVSGGNCTDIINYMVRVANEMWPVCVHCGYDAQGDTWGVTRDNQPEAMIAL